MDVWTGGRVERGINEEIRTDMCAMPCIKQIATGNLLYYTGHPAWS